MNKKAVLIGTFLVGCGALGFAKTWMGYIKMLEERFPEIDPKVIRKAYRKFMMLAITQKIAVSDLNDEEMDKIFRALAYEERFSK